MYINRFTTGLLNYSLARNKYSEWWSPSQSEHKLFTLILANPLEVRIVQTSGMEAIGHLVIKFGTTSFIADILLDFSFF
jgi:hypothetical protein